MANTFTLIIISAKHYITLRGLGSPGPEKKRWGEGPSVKGSLGILQPMGFKHACPMAGSPPGKLRLPWLATTVTDSSEGSD